MVVCISEGYIFVLVLIIALLAIAIILFYTKIKRNAPEALIIAKARDKGTPLALLHYPEGTIRLRELKVEKDVPGTSTPYFLIEKAGIKFRNPDGRKVERWEGDIPVMNYFVNMPESVAITDVVAYSQLKDHLKVKGMDIETIEDLAFFVLSEYERTGDMNVAMESAKIDSDETKGRVLNFLNYVEEHRKELESLKLESGIFTFQTAIRALDATIAYTSSNVAHMKSVIEASIRHQLESSSTDIMKYGVFVIMVALGLGTFIMLAKG